MRTNCILGTLLCLLAVAAQASAGQAPSTNEFAALKTKAEKGNAEAQFNLGLRYALGEDVPFDSGEAVKWYRKAADQGNAGAQNNLGVCYDSGHGVAQDYAEAVKWYRKAAEQGYAAAQYNLGMCYGDGRGVPQDDAEAVKLFRKAADAGDADAQNRLGRWYDDGREVVQDRVEAVNWYRKAADLGSTAAQYNLASCYADGRGVKQSDRQSAIWFRKAADQGDADAQTRLANCYYLGQGLKQNHVEAVKWYRKAAQQGEVIAQRTLGGCYSAGLGIEQDFGEAAKWYRKAADQADADAQFKLGECYDIGRGVTQAPAEAVKWYRKAAEQGAAAAQLCVGVCYTIGQGVPKSDLEAYVWLSLAAAQQQKDAARICTIVAKRMNRAEIAEGQRRAAAFVAKKGPPDQSGEGDRLALAGRQPKASGTGFFITDDGYLVTNAHVVEGATQVRLATKVGSVVATVVKVDAANDLALLKAEGKFVALPVVRSRAVKLGNTVATVGFPIPMLQGSAPKLSKGVVASLTGAGDDARYFQISVPVQPGNSGGALVDERGSVVGVVSAKLNARAALAASGALPENVNYAVKSSFLLSFLESVPEVSAKLKEPGTKDRKFEDVVKDAEQAAVLVLVY